MITVLPWNWPVESRRLAARGLTVVAGGLMAAVIAVALWHYWHPDSPLQAATLESLKAQSRQQPGDKALIENIRSIDVNVRQVLQRQRDREVLSGWLLLAGGVVLLWSLRELWRNKSVDPVAAAALMAATPAEQIPAWAAQPEGPGGAAPWKAKMAAGRQAVGLVGMAMLGSAVALAALAPAPIRAGSTSVSAAPTWPTSEEIHQNWPGFRGPDGDGVVPFAKVPTAWDGPKGTGVLWKTPIPLPGHNSPVIWGNRVFISGATKAKRQVYALDADSGAVVWTHDIEVPRVGGEIAEREEASANDAGSAAPTLAVDGRHIVAMFAGGELACLDFTGNVLWSQRFDTSDNPFGQAASPVIWHNRVIVQVDRGEPDKGKSLLAALDLETGRSIWRLKQPVGQSWSTPLIASAAGKVQLLAGGDPWLISYDPETGSEWWRAKVLKIELAPSPVFAGGAFIMAVPEGAPLAMKPDGKGDVTESHVLWQAEIGSPDICSPVAMDRFTFFIYSNGTLRCVENANGKEVWSHDYETMFQASPCRQGDTLYMLATDGRMFLAAAGDKFQDKGVCPLGKASRGSPAFAPGKGFIRTVDGLWCLGGQP